VTWLDIGPKLLQPDGTLSPEMAPDFLHPREQGYVIWAEALQPLIDRYLPPAPTPPAAAP
jgi:lysophospholipase L1-like esterase